jgi:protein-S-isoprenylcysteine O-methyltransferase Ste14
MRSGSNDKKNQDKGTIGLIWIFIFLSISLGVFFAIKTKFPISNQSFITYFGLVIIIAGMILRLISVYTLGWLFTVDVTIRDNHLIKKDGIYRIIRHPAYSGSLLSFVGLGISLNNWLSLVVITLLMTFSFLYRIKIEEKVLINQFGKDYLDYKKSTYFLIHWIY